MRQQRQKGSIITYALIAIFLIGLLVAAMSQGAKKSASTSQLDEMVLFALLDVKTIQGTIAECVQTNPTPTDVNGDTVIDTTDNPNAPFPLYSTGVSADTLANLSSGGTNTEATSDAGSTVTNIRCPGASDGQRAVFSRATANAFKLLGDTATYTTKYFNNTTEGSYIRITRATSEPLWTETIARLNKKFSPCAAAAVTAAGTCVNGCFYYWFVRLGTSTLGGEAAQPTCG